MTRKDLIMHQSGNFLCECLPDEFDEWDEKQFDEFIVQNAWQPFEYWEANDIWENIENAADSLIMFLKEQGIEVNRWPVQEYISDPLNPPNQTEINETSLYPTSNIDSDKQGEATVTVSGE